MKKNLPALLLFLILNLFFFHQMLQGLVPIPLDHLIGALFPWHDYPMGYGAGVPIRNPALSDVFSTIYPWRSLSMDLFKSGHLPLWNSFEFSGTPLLANLQSAVLYPLNFLMLIFGNLWGYSLVIFLQPLLSMFFVYLYLRQIKVSAAGAILGGVIFAFSGFMMTYMELSTASQAFLWVPLLLFFLEKFFDSKKTKWLFFFALAQAVSLLAGNLQVALYGILLSTVYGIFLTFYRLKSPRDRVESLVKLGLFTFLGTLVTSAQLFPSLELLSLSIRSTDANITNYNYGLIPLQNLITFLVPDFFGNPVTYNYWGFQLGYQEATFYFGLVPLIFVAASLFIYKKLTSPHFYFFLGTLIVSILLIFQTPVGKAIYFLKIPIFSTSYASRLILVLNLSSAILVALSFDFLKTKTKLLLQIASISLGFILMLALGIVASEKLLHLNPDLKTHLMVSLKNMIPSVVILVILIAIVKFIKKPILVTALLLSLTTLDLFRFGLKFTPFSESQFNFPQTPVLSFLQKNLGNYRFDREGGEVIPPNTWVPYKLQSPAGYDPLFSQDYSHFFSVYNNRPPQNTTTRYAELENYYSPYINLFGVKYLAVGKRNSIGAIDQTATSSASRFFQSRFETVLTDRSVIVLQNKDVFPRVSLFDKVDVEPDKNKAISTLLNNFNFRDQIILDQNPGINLLKSGQDSASIQDYSSEKITIFTQTKNPTILMLTDEYYPGWKATINGAITPIYRADSDFRAILLPGGNNQVQFIYTPDSFSWGVKTSITSLALLLFLWYICDRVYDPNKHRIFSRFK